MCDVISEIVEHIKKASKVDGNNYRTTMMEREEALERYPSLWKRQQRR